MNERLRKKKIKNKNLPGRLKFYDESQSPKGFKNDSYENAAKAKNKEAGVSFYRGGHAKFLSLGVGKKKP